MYTLETVVGGHDQSVGQAGTYNPIIPHIDFYKCLRGRVSLGWTVLYTFGATFGSIWKYPYLAYRKYQYRKENR